jgi:hypothetical protein
MYLCCCNCSTQSLLWQMYDDLQSIVSCYWADLNLLLPSVLFELVYYLRMVLYITHQNHMPTGPVVLRTRNFLGYSQGCGVLTVLHYRMVLKCTAHKRTYAAESMEEALQWTKDAELSKYKVSTQYHI